MEVYHHRPQLLQSQRLTRERKLSLAVVKKRGDLTALYMVMMMRLMIMSTTLLLISKISSLYQVMNLTIRFIELKHDQYDG